MKSFTEWMEGRLGMGEMGAVDFMQLSNGHWAGHTASGEVLVTQESYERGQYPDSSFSIFKFQPFRKASPEEAAEYHRRWAENRKDRMAHTDFDDYE